MKTGISLPIDATSQPAYLSPRRGNMSNIFTYFIHTQWRCLNGTHYMAIVWYSGSFSGAWIKSIFFISHNHETVKMVELYIMLPWSSGVFEELPTVPSWLLEKTDELTLTDGLTLHTKRLQREAFQERVVKLIQQWSRHIESKHYLLVQLNGIFYLFTLIHFQQEFSLFFKNPKQLKDWKDCKKNLSLDFFFSCYV